MSTTEEMFYCFFFACFLFDNIGQEGVNPFDFMFVLLYI